MKKSLFAFLLSLGCAVGVSSPAFAKTYVDAFGPHTGAPELCGKDLTGAIAHVVESAFNPKKDPARSFFATVVAGAGMRCVKNPTGTYAADLLVVVEYGGSHLAYRYAIIRLLTSYNGDFRSATLARGWEDLPLGFDDSRYLTEWCAFVGKEYPIERGNQEMAFCDELR